jgi:hypothetical protein
MSLRTFLGARDADSGDMDALREARVALARRMSTWREIPEPVRRGPWLVDAESDELFVVRRGATFEPGRAHILSGDGFPLSFYVDVDGDVVVLEKVKSPATWSEHVARQTSRG